MLVQISAVGRDRAVPETALTERYLELARGLARPLGFRDVGLVELVPRKTAPEARRAEEARLLAASLPEGAVRVALDERGEDWTTEALARRLAAWRDQGRPAGVFLIGGADGLDPALTAAAEHRLCLGRLTWPHRLARAMLAEQIYRCMSLLAGHPYHRA